MHLILLYDEYLYIRTMPLKSYKNKIAPFTLLIILCMFLFSFKKEASCSSFSYVGGNDTTDNYLLLKAHVRKSPKAIDIDKKEENIWLDSALITIYYNKIPYSEILTSKKGKCSFKLSLNKTYLIEVSKEGFVSKSFEVNTKVPTGQNEIYSFDFDIDIFEKVKGLDVSVLEKPIAKVAYNFLDERFAYDVGFTSKINAELKKMYRNYYILKQEQTDSIAKASSQLKRKSN